MRDQWQLHPMEMATQWVLSLLLGVSSLYVLYQRGFSFFRLFFARLIVVTVGRSLWERTQEAYGATVIVSIIALYALMAQPQMM
jgi:hypothetical protein